MAKLMALSVTRIGDGIYRVEGEGRSGVVYVAGTADDRWAFWNGRTFRVKSEAAGRAARRRHTSHALQSVEAPMPATVIRVLVAPGAAVKKGDTLVLLEAMKMELPLRASGDAVVIAVHCKDGERVEAGAILVDLE